MSSRPAAGKSSKWPKQKKPPAVDKGCRLRRKLQSLAAWRVTQNVLVRQHRPASRRFAITAPSAAPLGQPGLLSVPSPTASFPLSNARCLLLALGNQLKTITPLIESCRRKGRKIAKVVCCLYCISRTGPGGRFMRFKTNVSCPFLQILESAYIVLDLGCLCVIQLPLSASLV